MKRIYFFIPLVLLSLVMGAYAQEPAHMHEHHPADTAVRARDTLPGMHSGQEGHEEPAHSMSHSFSRNLPMSRNGSGTSWMPDASPMYMYMKSNGNTSWMIHGSAFLRYNKQDVFNKGSRGGNLVDAPNWFMVMMNTKTGKRGLFHVSAMLSLDPLTVGKEGYPLLFQSGETFEGRRLVDRQHPHDLFAELSVGYTHMISRDIDVFGYFGYPGEPALSAPAFMHRVSAMNNPDAPLGHHWQDATHISFGVATGGLRYKNWKAEFSSFTGREPDENRYNFDKPRFDSYSYRLSFNPTRSWALQVSKGYINSPEALAPDEDVTRTTFSALFTKPLGKRNHSLASAFVWGLNDKGHDHKEHSVLWENNLQLLKSAVYNRYEFVQKSPEELNLDENVFTGHRYNVHAFTLGFNHRILPLRAAEVLAGLQGTVYFPADALKNIYGTSPVAMQVYLQIRPSLHKH